MLSNCGKSVCEKSHLIRYFCVACFSLACSKLLILTLLYTPINSIQLYSRNFTTCQMAQVLKY